MPGIQRLLDLPDNSDKVLFAEDFVNHILLRFKLPLLSSGIANRRAFIYNAFNSEAKLAANYVFRCLEEEILQEFDNIINENNNYLDINAFLKYAIPLKFHACVLPTELGARNLLRFCVKISTMAAKFYTQGYLDAPVLAVDYITSLLTNIDMVHGQGWIVLNTVATTYAQKFAEMDNSYLTPDDSASDNSDSLSTLSSHISEASSSPDHEMDGDEDQNVHPEEFSDDDHCNSSISDSRHVEKSNNVKPDNIVSLFRSTSDSGSSNSSKNNHSSTSFHSFEGTSSEGDDSKQKIRKKLNKKPSCSHFKESDSDSDNYETDPKKTTECVGTFGRQLTVEKVSAIFSSSADKLHESDSGDSFKTPNSDCLASEDVNESSMEEGDRVQCSRAKSPPLLSKPILKRK